MFILSTSTQLYLSAGNQLNFITIFFIHLLIFQNEADKVHGNVEPERNFATNT